MPVHLNLGFGNDALADPVHQYALQISRPAAQTGQHNQDDGHQNQHARHLLHKYLVNGRFQQPGIHTRGRRHHRHE